MSDESQFRLMREPFRMQAVQTPIIPVIAEQIRNTPGTISLGQGVVYYPPPPETLEAIQGFFNDPENHKYKAVDGIPGLAGILRSKLISENSIGLNAPGSRLVVTAGGNMAFMNAVLAITDPGDEVILLTPYYFNHEMALAMANCKTVLVATDENYQLRPDAIRRAMTARTRAVVTVSPNNPSGAVYPEAALREVNAICREHGVYHISDEAYENFLYDGAVHFSPASISGSAAHTISLYSLSKAYGFASWRIGYMVVPEQLFESIKKIQDTILICPPAISQVAATGALSAGSEYCRAKLSAIAETRASVRHALNQIGDIIDVPQINGAFYYFVKVNTNSDALSLALQLIREHRVAVMPGTAFGMNEGCYLRIAYGALQRQSVEEGIGRLVKGLRGICGIKG